MQHKKFINGKPVDINGSYCRYCDLIYQEWRMSKMNNKLKSPDNVMIHVKHQHKIFDEINKFRYSFIQYNDESQECWWFGMKVIFTDCIKEEQLFVLITHNPIFNFYKNVVMKIKNKKKESGIFTSYANVLFKIVDRKDADTILFFNNTEIPLKRSGITINKKYWWQFWKRNFKKYTLNCIRDFKRYRLLKYEVAGGFILSANQGIDYIFTIEYRTFWGLFRKIDKVRKKFPSQLNTSSLDKELNVWKSDFKF